MPSRAAARADGTTRLQRQADFVRRKTFDFGGHGRKGNLGIWLFAKGSVIVRLRFYARADVMSEELRAC